MRKRYSIFSCSAIKVKNATEFLAVAQQWREALQQLFVVAQEKQEHYSYFFDVKADKN